MTLSGLQWNQVKGFHLQPLFPPKAGVADDSYDQSRKESCPMNVVRFLHHFVTNGSGPGRVASELKLPGFSQRPGMHQPIEEPCRTPLTIDDRELLHAMGICSVMRPEPAAQSTGSESDSCGDKVNTGASRQPDFPGGKVPI